MIISIAIKKKGFMKAIVSLEIPRNHLVYFLMYSTQIWVNRSWRHWICITDRVLQNMKKALDGKASNLHGYSALTDEDKKVAKSLISGKVTLNTTSREMQSKRNTKKSKENGPNYNRGKVRWRTASR